MPPITIRRAIESDCDGLVALFTELDDFHRRERPDLFRVIEGPARERSFLRGLIEGPDSVVFVAEEDDALLGLSVVILHSLAATRLRPERRFAEVDSFGLTARARRQGVGQRLMQTSENWAREKGAPKLELQVHGFNRSAMAFYEAEGFAPMMIRMERVLR